MQNLGPDFQPLLAHLLSSFSFPLSRVCNHAQNQSPTQCARVCLHCLAALNQHLQLSNQASNRQTIFTTVLSALNNPCFDTNHDHCSSTRSRDSVRPTRFIAASPTPAVVPCFLGPFHYQKLSPSISRFSTRKNR